MTTYAHDPLTNAILAFCPTGDGAVAHRVARVPRAWDDETARCAAGALTVLSARLWLAYADHRVDDVRPDVIVDALCHPNRPAGELLFTEEDDCVEAAHHLGRIVSRAPGRALWEAIRRDVRAEIDAVLDADGGDLTGRARQAVTHVRPDAPDDQVLAAHALLHDDPFGPPQLLTAVEPHAAATAALRWLRAATTVTATLVGHPVADVIALAEAIAHDDLAVARHVLVEAAPQPDALLLQDMLQEAVLAGRGYVLMCPDLYEPDDGGERRHRAIALVLDPREPGRCLVAGLIRGIQGCFRVYIDEIATRECPGLDPLQADPERVEEFRTRFFTEVREAMRTIR